MQKDAVEAIRKRAGELNFHHAFLLDDQDELLIGGRGFSRFEWIAGTENEAAELMRDSRPVGILAKTPDGKNCLITDSTAIHSNGNLAAETSEAAALAALLSK